MAQQIQFKKKQLSMIFCEYSFNAYALLLHEHVKLQFEPNRTDAGLVRWPENLVPLLVWPEIKAGANHVSGGE